MSDWKSEAAKLPYGSSRRFSHCGSSPAARMYHKAEGVSFYCFRCQERGFQPHGVRSPREILALREATGRLRKPQSFPYGRPRVTDAGVSSAAILWLLRANITPETADRHGFRYDPDTGRVLIPVRDGFLARSVDGSNPKYIFNGDPKKALWYNGEFNAASVRHLVVVEDVLSAIRVHHLGHDVLALLGTKPSGAAVRVAGAYKTVLCWTDGDKAGDEAFVALRKRLRLYSTQIKRIRTDSDPKALHGAYINERISHAIDPTE